MIKISKISEKLNFEIIKKGFQNRNECVIELIKKTDQYLNLKNFTEIIINTDDRDFPSDNIYKTENIKNNDGIIYYITQTDDFKKCFPDFNFVLDIYQKTNIFCFKNDIARNHVSFKIDKVGWFGNINVTDKTTRLRRKLFDIGNNNKHLLDFVHVDSLNPKNFKNTLDIIKTYSILLDIEGGGYSARLKYLLFSKRPLLVVYRPYKEFFYEKLTPWIHYIPVKRDLSDLLDKVKWIFDNRIEALIIADNALCFATKTFTEDNIYNHIKNLIEHVQNKI